ncbi:MAG: amino acid permease [Candidatus Thermoplasmatota archaeon]
MFDDLIKECKKRFLVTKPVEEFVKEVDVQKYKLKRALNAMDLTCVGIGAIIGAGIFVLTGVASAKFAGPAIVLSFVIAGLVCAIAALCYAEFSSLIPISGSAYTYSYATMGELFAWMIGWDLILEYAVGAVAVSVGWSGYFVSILGSAGILFPSALSGGFINLPAVFIVLALTALLVIGVKESVRVNLAIVIIKIAIIVFVISYGLMLIKPANYEPFMPYGFGGVMTGAAIVFFAYIGFDAVSTTAEEAKEPKKDLPIGIFASLIICTILYICMARVLTGMVPFLKLNVPDPAALAFQLHGIYWAQGIVAAGALAGITSVLLVSLIAQPRIFFALSRDRLLPGLFSNVHPRYATPYKSTIITGVIVAFFAAFTPIDVAAELVNIGTLFAFVLVCGGIIFLRKNRPDLKAKFRVPFVPVLPIMGVAFCIGLMLSLPLITWLRFIIWLGIGLLIYANYGYYRSKVVKNVTE